MVVRKELAHRFQNLAGYLVSLLLRKSCEFVAKRPGSFGAEHPEFFRRDWSLDIKLQQPFPNLGCAGFFENAREAVFARSVTRRW